MACKERTLLIFKISHLQPSCYLPSLRINFRAKENERSFTSSVQSLAESPEPKFSIFFSIYQSDRENNHPMNFTSFMPLMYQTYNSSRFEQLKVRPSTEWKTRFGKSGGFFFSKCYPQIHWHHWVKTDPRDCLSTVQKEHKLHVSTGWLTFS